MKKCGYVLFGLLVFQAYGQADAADNVNAYDEVDYDDWERYYNLPLEGYTVDKASGKIVPNKIDKNIDNKECDNAEDVVVYAEDFDLSQDSEQNSMDNSRVNLDKAADKSSLNKKNFEGFYVGLGVTHNCLKSRVTMDDNMSQLAVFNHPKDFKVSKGYYFEPDSHVTAVSSNKSQFGGNISIGYGEFISGNSWFTDNCYVGIESIVDMMSNCKIHSDTISVRDRNNPSGKIEFGKCLVKYNGIMPTVAVRFGGYIPGIESMIFLKAGGKYLSYNMYFEFFPNEKLKQSTIVPIVGLGIERNIGYGFSVKTEADYMFKSSKTFDVSFGKFLNGPDKNYKAQIKHNVQGYTVRLIGVYHF